MNEQPAKTTIASGEVCVGDLVAAFLETCGLTTAFGVISIHNLPILDAIARRGRIRFIPARGEAGALNMADAYARVSGGLGLGITSTGVAAGNAAGSLIEAMVAGSPVLHLTGQIETSYLDKGQAYIQRTPVTSPRGEEVENHEPPDEKGGAQDSKVCPVDAPVRCEVDEEEEHSNNGEDPEPIPRKPGSGDRGNRSWTRRR